MKLHMGTMFAGVVYLVIGLAFVAEAIGWWGLEASDLRYAGPLALIVAGLALAVGSLRHPRDI